jgi:DNA-binding transcriptional LysR family regulator
MERRALEYFVAAAEHRSLTSAAKTLHMSQPALSRAIKSIETELGVPLFRRAASGIEPTDAGERLLRRARAVLADFESLLVEARGTPASISGHLRVGLTPPMTVEPTTSAIARILSAHPGITVTSLRYDATGPAVDAVSRGACDIALVGSEQRPIARRVRVEKLYVDELVIMVPPGSSLAVAGRVAPADLAGLPFIAEPEGTEIRRLIDDYVDRFGLRVVAELSHRQGIAPMVESGVGMAIIPRGLLPIEGRPGIVARGIDPPVEVPIWMITRPDLTPAEVVFAAMVRAVSGELGHTSA